MKTRLKIWICVSVITILTGCIGADRTGVTTPQAPAPPPEEKPAFHYTQQQDLSPAVNQAILTAKALDAGNHKALPFVRIDNDAIIEIDPMAVADKNRQVIHIGGFYNTSDGDMKIDFTTQSTDGYGRIDFRLVTMVYRAEEPDEDRTNAVKEWLLDQYSPRGGKYADRLSNDDWKAFQQEAGLSADGIFGPKTATELARTFPVIHVKDYRNKIIYPDIPNHMLFVVPRDRFVSQMGSLPQGFRSWSDVKNMSLSKDQFRKMAQKGTRFVLCVYFFDRVSPVSGITCQLSQKPGDSRRSSDSAPYFTRPGTWPVIIRPFEIKKTPDDLYINLFIQRSTNDNRCIGSHKLI